MNKSNSARTIFNNSKNTISLTSFLIYAPISTLAVVTALVRQIDSSNVMNAFLIGVVATCFTGLGIIFLNFTLAYASKKNKTSALENLKFVNLILCGAIRGVIVFYLIESSSFQQPSGFGFRVLSSTANFFFWILLIDRVIDENRRFGNEYRTLISASILKLAENQPSDARKIPANWEREYKEIQDLLGKTLEKVKLEEFKPENLVSAAASLRQIIDNRVRPFSHQLWASSANAVPRVQLSAIASSSFQNPVIPALPISLSIGLITAVNFTSTFGLTRGLLSSIFLAVTFFAYFKYLHKQILRSGNRNQQKGFVSLLIPGVVTTLCFYLINKFYFQESYGLFTLILIPSSLIVCSAFAIYEVNKLDRENILLQIEQGVAEFLKKNQTSNTTTSERVATYLHNALQPELLALSHQLEEAAHKADLSETKEIVEKVASKLNRSLQEDLPSTQINLMERLLKIRGAWKGLIDVQIDISQDFLDFAEQNFMIAQIVDEAIANAVRHQSAKSIKVFGKKLEGNGLRLLITSQGAAKPQGNLGMGSELLNRYFGTNWERRTDGQETVLQIDL